MASLPSPFSAIPSHPLLFPDYTVQVTPLPRLSAHLSPQKGPSLYMCHEHTNSPLAFGGNKIRKLEYIIPSILSSQTTPKVTTLVTTGGIQSNHQRAVAAVAAHLGLKCVLLPLDTVATENQPVPDVYAESGNVQLTRLLVAELMPAGSDPVQVMQQLERRSEVPYWIPSGGSSHEMGGLGYAKWAFELDQWETVNQVHFAAVIVACASGSTLGGMVAGFKYLVKKSITEGFGCPRKRKILLGIDAGLAKGENDTRDIVLEIAKRTGVLIGLDKDDITAEDVVVDRKFNAGAYGKCDAQTQEAMRSMARFEGVVLDPVYTGKAAAGLIGLVKEGRFKDGENVLFVHTGGQMALSAYPGIN